MTAYVLDGPMSQPAPNNTSGLVEFMTGRQLSQLDIKSRHESKDWPTMTHAHCKAKTGVHRPGKTAKDKARGTHKSRHAFKVNRDAHRRGQT
jgi:hypothetical protein